MTAEEIKARLDIPDANVSRSINGGYWHVVINREHEGHRYMFSRNIYDTETGPNADFVSLHNEINEWWQDTITSPI